MGAWLGWGSPRPRPGPAPCLLPLRVAASRVHLSWPWRPQHGGCTFSLCCCCFVVRRHLGRGTPSPRGLGTHVDYLLPASSLDCALLFTRVWKGRRHAPAHPAGFVEGLHNSSNLRGAEGKGFGLQEMHRVLCGTAMS